MPVPGGVDSVLPFGNFKLEVAFASGPDTASPTWTDITSFWRLASQTQITRGRNSEQDDISPGLMSLTLDNTDGRFTPGNAGSPYYPNVKIRKQIRLTYTPAYAGSTTFPVFHGHVDEWPTQWPTGDDTYTEALVTASDRMKRLGQLLPLRGVPQETILADGVRAYWPLTEPSGSTVAGDISAAGVGSSMTQVVYGTGGTVEFGNGTGPATDSSTAMVMTGTATNGNSLQATSTVGFNDPSVPALLSFEVTFATTTASQTLLSVYDAGGRTGGNVLSVKIDGSGFLRVDSPNPLPSATSSTSVLDGHTHNLAVELGFTGSTTNLIMFLDGVHQTDGQDFFWTTALPTFTVVELGPATGTFSHLAVSSVNLGTHNHAAGILNGYAGESSNARIARYAGWVGMASFLNLDTGASTSIAHIDATGRGALDVMKDVATTENGQLFAGRDGRITFHSRTRRYNAASEMTVSTVQQDIGEGLQFRTNDQYLVNDVTATSAGAGSVRVTDATSISDYGWARTDLNVFTTNPSEGQSLAEWLVGTRKTPMPRAEQLQIDLLAASSSSRLTALGLDISSRITLSGLPATASASTADLFVEGYTETISLTEWTRTYNTSPFSPAGDVWKLEDPVYGAIDSGHLITY